MRITLTSSTVLHMSLSDFSFLALSSLTSGPYLGALARMLDIEPIACKDTVFQV